MSDFMDIESVRSKYADLTVTAVPTVKETVTTATSTPSVGNIAGTSKAATTEEYHVEITRVPVAASTRSANARLSKDTSKFDIPAAVKSSGIPAAIASNTAYAREYAGLMAKLEYTKLMQAQLAMLQQQPVPNKYSTENILLPNASALNMSNLPLDPSLNIQSSYENLLAVIAGMRENIALSYLGARCPKERLLRDIAQARVHVRGCQLLLEREEHKDVLDSM